MNDVAEKRVEDSQACNLKVENLSSSGFVVDQLWYETSSKDLH